MQLVCVFCVSTVIWCEADPPNPGVQLLNPGSSHFLWGEELFYTCMPGSFLHSPTSQKCGFAHGQVHWSGFNPLCKGMAAWQWVPEDGKMITVCRNTLDVHEESAEGSGTLQCGRVFCSGTVFRCGLQWSWGYPHVHQYICSAGVTRAEPWSHSLTLSPGLQENESLLCFQQCSVTCLQHCSMATGREPTTATEVT